MLKMPDISMCNNEHCPLREKCYRYTAKPSEPHQWYADFQYERRFDYAAKQDMIWCLNFIAIPKKTQNDPLKENIALKIYIEDPNLNAPTFHKNASGKRLSKTGSQ